MRKDLAEASFIAFDADGDQSIHFVEEAGKNPPVLGYPSGPLRHVSDQASGWVVVKRVYADEKLLRRELRAVDVLAPSRNAPHLQNAILLNVRGDSGMEHGK